MNRRALGRTGLEISELVIGGGFVGGILIDADLETRLALYDRALAGPIGRLCRRLNSLHRSQ